MGAVSRPESQAIPSYTVYVNMYTFLCTWYHGPPVVW